MTRPVWMILIGFVMVLVGGIVMPFLMLPGVGVIPLDRLNTALAFLIPIFFYAVSLAGLFLGMTGAVFYVRLKKPPQQSSSREKNPFVSQP